jgi:hypothetical protein
MLLLETKIPEFDRYLEDSAEFWKRADHNRARDKGFVVVDLLHNNAAVILGNLYVARCAAHCYNARLAAVVSERFIGFPTPIAEVRRLGTAFGVERFYQVDSKSVPTPDRPLLRRIRGWIGTGRDRLINTIRHKTGDALRREILDLHVEGIHVGDLIYDTYLRKTARASIESTAPELIDEIDAAFSRMRQYRDIMVQRDHIACVTSDNSYIDFAGLLRTTVALGKIGIAKVMASPFSVRKYRSIEECHDLPWPREADVELVRRCWGSKLSREAADFFPPHHALAEENSLFQIGYGDHLRRPSAADLSARLGFPPDAPVVGVMASMFDDAPHCIPDLLHQDYARWLEETLAICATAEHVSWLVRSHPYSVTVGATSEFERIVAPYVSRYPHIKTCPYEVATEALFPMLRAIVTVASTAGLEFASAGIPPVICGRPYYADIGFTLRPKDKIEYAAALHNIDRMPPLTAAQISTAKEIAYIYFRLTQQTPGVMPPTIDLGARKIGLDDIANYWKRAAEILRDFKLQDDPVWHNFQRMEELDRSLLLRFDQLEHAP